MKQITEAILNAAGSSLDHLPDGIATHVIDTVSEFVPSWKPLTNDEDDLHIRDGREVQIWSDEGWVPRAKWNADQGWYDEYWDADWQCYSKAVIYNPTHYMPAPTAPFRK